MIFIDRLQLQNISGKPIKLYSSGMKQRVRLALAFFTQASVLLLDEPCSNLDAQGMKWYRQSVGIIHRQSSAGYLLQPPGK
jgi:ABC-type multidrug transport system ATPase subunit